jgi:hypothetical protein
MPPPCQFCEHLAEKSCRCDSGDSGHFGSEHEALEAERYEKNGYGELGPSRFRTRCLLDEALCGLSSFRAIMLADGFCNCLMQPQGVLGAAPQLSRNILHRTQCSSNQRIQLNQKIIVTSFRDRSPSIRHRIYSVVPHALLDIQSGNAQISSKKSFGTVYDYTIIR